MISFHLLLTTNVQPKHIWIGGSGNFRDNEVMTVTVPAVDIPCSTDFYFALWTDDYPERITWNLVNEEDDTVLSGKGN